MPLEDLGSFLDEYNARKDEPDFDIDQFNQDYQRGLSSTGINRVQPVTAGEIKSKGFLRETAEAVAGGVSDAAEMWMRAIRTTDPEGGNDVIRDFATAGLAGIQNFVSKHPSLAPNANIETGVKRWWVEGVRSFVPSLSAALPGVVVGAVTGGPIGAAVGSTFGGAIFGLAEHDRFKEEVEDYITDNELSTEDAAVLREQGASQAIYSAITEGGLEGAANVLETLSLGLFRPVRRVIQGVAAQPIKQLFKKSAGQIAKEAAIRLPRTAAIEVGTEVTQAALETKFRRDIGLTDMSSMDAAMSVIGPSLVTTLLFMGAAGGANSLQRAGIRKAIEDAKADPNRRKQAINEISEIVRATGQPDSEALADQLLASGNRFVDEGISINLNTQVGVQNSLGEIIKGLQLGELDLKTTQEYANKLEEGLGSEELSGQERVKTSQLFQGITAINNSFEAQVPTVKPKIKKRKATASDKLRDLGTAATIKGKVPEVREFVLGEGIAEEAAAELQTLADKILTGTSLTEAKEFREEVTAEVARIPGQEVKPVEEPEVAIAPEEQAEEEVPVEEKVAVAEPTPKEAPIEKVTEEVEAPVEAKPAKTKEKKVIPIETPTQEQARLRKEIIEISKALRKTKGAERTKLRTQSITLKKRLNQLEEISQPVVQAVRLKIGDVKPFTDLPESAKGAIQAKARVKITNEGLDPKLALKEIEKKQFIVENINISDIRKNNTVIFSDKFRKRGSVTKGPIVLDIEGKVIDGNNRVREAFDKGEQSIRAFVEQGPITPEAKPEVITVPLDAEKELATVEKELGEATSIFVKANTKGKAKREAKAKVEELQKRRDELRAAVEAGPQLNPVDQAKKNITDKMGVLSLGVDPTIIKDMGVVGAHHFNSGLKTFTSWSKAMINDLGSAVKTFLRRIWRTVRRGDIKTDETTRLQAEAIKIEKEEHPEAEIQAEQIKTVAATSETIDEGKTTPDVIEQLNHFITHNDYNVLHDEESKNKIKEVFPDIQDEDISTVARVTGLPYWKGKKFAEWQRSVGIEIKRTESKNLLKFEFGRKVFKRSEVNEGSRADVHEFFALKGESETRVSAVILEGDARRTEFTNDQLIEKGVETIELDKVTDEYKEFGGKSIKLNPEELTAYRAWQVTMKKIRRKMVEANENLLYKPYENKTWVGDLRKVVAAKAAQIKPVQATLGLAEEQKEEEIKAPDLTAKDIPKGLNEADQKAFTKAYNTVIKPKSRIQELRKQMGELKGYVPHLRDEGTVKVSFIDKEGQTRDSSILKNDRQADKYITERRAFHKARGNEYTVSKERVARTPEFLYQEVSVAALERFSDKALERVKISKQGKDPGKITTEDLDEIRGAMKQALSDELSARGFGERTLKRTRGPNIGGYRVADLKGILAGYISGSSGFMTKMEAAYEQGQLLSDIDVKTKPNLYQEISIYGRNMMRNLTRADQISSKIRTFAFVWYLSGQLKSPAVNFTQNWILGIPTLAKFTTGARRKYNRAMFDISTNRLSDVEKKALLEAQKRGITGDQLMQDIFGQMQQNTNKSVQKVIKVLSFAFSASEILNRKFAFLARFRAGIGKGESFDQAFDGAREFVFDVHFLFGKENQAIIASGGTPFSNAIRTSLTFRNYTFNYMNAMKNHIGDRNFALVGRSLAYMALLGGLSSLPFLDDFLDMWERFTGIPIRKKIQQELKGVGGDILAVVGTQGLPALIGVDLSGSLRIHLPDPTDPARLFEESVFGVYEGLAVKAKDSFQSILDGEPLRALEQAAPIFIEKPLKAWRVSRDGKVTTKTGKTIFTAKGRPLQLSAREAITQAIGFRPSKLAFESGKFRQFTNVERNFQIRRTNLFRKLRFAKTSSDRNDVLRAIREYNNAARKLRGAVPLITSDSLRRTLKEIPSKRFRAFSRAI